MKFVIKNKIELGSNFKLLFILFSICSFESHWPSSKYSFNYFSVHLDFIQYQLLNKFVCASMHFGFILVNLHFFLVILSFWHFSSFFSHASAFRFFLNVHLYLQRGKEGKIQWILCKLSIETQIHVFIHKYNKFLWKDKLCVYVYVYVCNILTFIGFTACVYFSYFNSVDVKWQMTNDTFNLPDFSEQLNHRLLRKKERKKEEIRNNNRLHQEMTLITLTLLVSINVSNCK